MNRPIVPDESNPFILPPSTAWGPVDVFYHSPGLTITSWKQWNVYLGCGSNNQTCWGNPQQFITDLNGSRFIHLLDQYTHSVKPKRYPLSNTYIFSTSPVGTFLSEADTFAWLSAAVGTAAGLAGNTAASVTGSGNVYHLYTAAGTDICADPSNTQCYSPDNLSTFAFCGYHSWVDFGPPYNRVYFTVEPYQAVNGCFSSPPDLPVRPRMCFRMRSLNPSAIRTLMRGTGLTLSQLTISERKLAMNARGRTYFRRSLE